MRNMLQIDHKELFLIIFVSLLIIPFQCLLVQGATHQGDLGFKLSDISNKTVTDVEIILGKPKEIRTEKITLNKKKQNTQRGIYRDGKIEV